MQLIDKRILNLWELLSVFLDENFLPGKYLMFQGKLFYSVLYKYASDWCKGLGLPLEIIGEFESTLEEFRSFFVDWVRIVCNLFWYLFSFADILLPP